MSFDAENIARYLTVGYHAGRDPQTGVQRMNYHEYRLEAVSREAIDHASLAEP